MSDNIMAILCLIFAAISIIGNLMVIRVIRKFKSLKTSMNLLFLNLANVDIITGIFGIYYIIIGDVTSLFGTSEILEKVYNKSQSVAVILCKLKVFFWFSSAITPTLLVLVALERYMAVVHPIAWRRRGEGRNMKWIILPCWLFGLSFLLIKIFTITYLNGKCKNTSPSWYNLKIYAVIVIMLHFLLPFSIIFWAYYKVIQTLTAKDSLSVQPSIAGARSRDRKIVIIVVILITLVFLVCIGVPKMVFSFQILFHVKLYNINGYIPVLLFLINSSSSPVIYFTFIRSFRRKLILSMRFWARMSTNETT